jgi:hypothetical protein
VARLRLGRDRREELSLSGNDSWCPSLEIHIFHFLSLFPVMLVLVTLLEMSLGTTPVARRRGSGLGLGIGLTMELWAGLG